VLGFRCVRVVGVRRIVDRAGCCMACSLVPNYRARVNHHVMALVSGRRLLLRVVRTNGIVGYRLIVFYGWLGIRCCRYVLPRYDLNELARAVALALGFVCCSSMSG
jgi:hypothetical protein